VVVAAGGAGSMTRKRHKAVPVPPLQETQVGRLSAGPSQGERPLCAEPDRPAEARSEPRVRARSVHEATPAATRKRRPRFVF